MFEVYATIPESMGPKEIITYAQRAETLGYDGLHVPDAVHDGLLLAAMALNATTRLKVGTSVLVAFPRSPMTVAIAAWDLQSMSNGRFELGLGTQIKQNIEQRYSTAWTAPVPRMREYIGSLRAIFDCFQNGDKLEFVGKHYQFTRLQPFFNPGPLSCGAPKVFMGAVGPLMTALAGEVSDGLITHPSNTPPRYIKEVTLPRLQKGVQRSGRSLDEVKLMLGTLLATGNDEQAVLAAREKQRKLLGFLFSTPSYWPSLELFAWQDRGEQLQQLTREARWQEMAGIIDDEMLDTFVPAATYQHIAKVINELYGGLATAINFPLPEDPRDDVLAAKAIAALQEKNREFR